MVSKWITPWFPGNGGRVGAGRCVVFPRQYPGEYCHGEPVPKLESGYPAPGSRGGAFLEEMREGRRGKDFDIIFSGNSVRRDLKNHEVVAW